MTRPATRAKYKPARPLPIRVNYWQKSSWQVVTSMGPGQQKGSSCPATARCSYGSTKSIKTKRQPARPASRIIWYSRVPVTMTTREWSAGGSTAVTKILMSTVDNGGYLLRTKVPISTHRAHTIQQFLLTLTQVKAAWIRTPMVKQTHILGQVIDTISSIQYCRSQMMDKYKVLLIINHISD